MRQIHRGALVALGSAVVATIAACVSLDSAPLTGDCTKLDTLSLGTTFADSIGSNSCRLSNLSYADFYYFKVDSATSRLFVTLKAPGSGAFMWLSDTTSAEDANTTVTQSSDTLATMHLFLRPGSYRLAVNSLATTPSGPFTVTTALDTTHVSGCTPYWITGGVTTTQTITNADCKPGVPSGNYIYHLYLAVIPAGGEFKLTEHSTAFTPQVLVVSYNSGSIVAYSTTDSTNTNALVDDLSSVQDALLVYVGSTDSLQIGSYTLTRP